MMDSWHSYPSIFAMGHKALGGRLTGTVLVEEKIDGSQFSFGVTEEGDLKVRSKGAEIYPEAPEALFKRAVDSVCRLAPVLHVGWTYRAEYLSKPKHNALAYDRAPAQHLILFDVNTGHEEYLGYNDLALEGVRLGLDVVPLLFMGVLEDVEQCRQFLDCESILGGQKVEGVVVKPAAYDIFGSDKKVVMGKFVSEAFKETHAKAWGEANPGQRDIIQRVGLTYQSQARWQKAVQHLREAGQIEDSPRDIGLLMREVPEDVLRECGAEMKELVWDWAWPQLRRVIGAGLPEWYKDLLLRKQFEEETDGA